MIAIVSKTIRRGEAKAKSLRLMRDEYRIIIDEYQAMGIEFEEVFFDEFITENSELAKVVIAHQKPKKKWSES